MNAFSTRRFSSKLRLVLLRNFQIFISSLSKALFQSSSRQRKTVYPCMTSASELFHNWRSRPGRISGPFSGPDSDSDPDPSLVRRPRRRRGPSRLRSNWEYNTRSEHAASNSNNGDTNPHYTMRVPRTNQLPSSVLLARARVLERLRGVSLMGGRASISWGEDEEDDVFRLIDIRRINSPFIILNNNNTELNENLFFQSISGADNRPPGLTKEAFNLLKLEVFEMDELTIDCCICLEKFNKGVKVMKLNCSHIFHPECLEPWVRKCGDCPYCRSTVIL